MRISVALCTYEGEQFLAEQLESIAAQTCLPTELIVCDDHSTDSTMDIVHAFARTASFDVRIRQNAKRLGPTKNFEQAMRLCAGDVIALCDQDDVWYSHKLETIKAVLSKSLDAGVVFSDALVVDAQLRPAGYSLWQSLRFNRRQQKQMSEGAALAVLLKHHVVTGATMAFRARFREYVLPIPETWVHDAWISLMIGVVAKLALVYEPLVKYRQHSRNLIGTGGDFAALAADALNGDPSLYRLRYEQYVVARNWLKDRVDVPRREAVIAQLEAKTKHLQARAIPTDRKTYRLMRLLREFVSLRYLRYSSGLYSFVKDLLVTNN